MRQPQIPHARSHPRIRLWKGQCARRMRRPERRIRQRRHRLCSCRSWRRICGAIARTRSNSSPAYAYGDGAEVGADAVVLAVHVAEFGVEVDVGTNLAGDAAAEVVAKFVLAGIEEFSVYWKASGITVSPPGEEGIASRSWNRGRGFQFARAADEGRPEDDVSAPVFRSRNIDDGIERERVGVTGCAARLSEFQCRVTERQIIELEIEAQSEILAGVAGDASSHDAASAAHEVRSRSVRQTGAAAHVEGPVLVVLYLRRFGGLFRRGLLTAAGLLVGGLLGLRRLRGRLLRRGLLSANR